MTDSEAKKLAELAAAATPGPWLAHDAHGFYVASHADLGIGDDPVCVADLSPGSSLQDWNGTREDAAFIAASRSAIPALLAERDALKAECERLRNTLKMFAEKGIEGSALIALHHRESSALRSENESLKAALREACDIGDKATFVPPPYAPPAPTSIDGSVKAFTVVIDPSKAYRIKARLAYLRQKADSK